MRWLLTYAVVVRVGGQYGVVLRDVEAGLLLGSVVGVRLLLGVLRLRRLAGLACKNRQA